jgi:hypothetical protein
MVAACVVGGAQQRHGFVGFDRNEYPGDAALPALRKHFSFVGYWLTNPPGGSANSWKGKRQILLARGFGFAVLADGRTDSEILGARKRQGLKPAELGGKDGAAAVAAARREGFAAGTILFLDQEEGGRLLAEQAEYLRGWTEKVGGGGYRAGVYASGQPVDEGGGTKITTAEDIRARVASGYFKEKVAVWVYQDACPPSNGCRMEAPALEASGTPGAVMWQYAQSPRRKEITAACAKTYAADGNCYAPELPGLHLDLSVSGSADPSHGR